MKITALTNNNSTNQQLANYTLSLFEQTKIEVVDVTCETLEDISIKIKDSSLVVLVMDKENSLPENVIANKPILLMSVFKKGLEPNTFELMKSTIARLKKANNTILGTYQLLDTNEAFNSELEIDNIGKRLELIRMINSIMYHDLGIRDNNHFSCGITPPKHYVGDSIGY